MLRKFINNLEKNEMDKMPFYSWNCLTLSLKHRDVDLVIKDEKDMEYILKFLIMKLETVDGMRGSALPLIEALNAQIRKEKAIKQFTPKQEHIFTYQNMHVLLNKVYFRYQIMKIRQKISYHAYLKNMTINELFLAQIIKTFNVFLNCGDIKLCSVTKEREQRISKLINEGSASILTVFQIAEELQNKNHHHHHHDKGDHHHKHSFVREVYKDVCGMTKVKIIRKDEEEQKLRALNRLFSRDSILDIFRDSADIQKGNFIGTWHSQFLTFKVRKIIIELELNRLNCMMQMGMLNGLPFLHASRRKIALVRELTTLELEQGKEILIPKQLSQDHLSFSFRFYDPITRILKCSMSKARKEYYQNQKSIFQEYYKEDMIDKLKQQLGLVESDKLKQVQVPINYKKRKEIDIYDNAETHERQRSKFLQIDINNDLIARPSKSVGKLLNTGYDQVKTNVNKAGASINLTYMSQREVNKNRNAQLVERAKFMIQHDKLRRNGRNQQLIGKLRDWIESDLVETAFAASVTDRSKLNFSLTTRKSKTVVGMKSTEYQKNLLAVQLLDVAQGLLKKKTDFKKQNQVSSCKAALKRTLPFQDRMSYLTKEIESLIRFFK